MRRNLTASQRMDLATRTVRCLFDLFLVNGERVTGQSLSYVQAEARGTGLLPSNTTDAEDTLMSLGFQIADGKHEQRGYSARVVYLPGR